METKEREPEVLFVGDSLIAHLLYTDLWETVFEPLHPLNFGIGGDQTQHVLWRLENGELDNIKPKVISISDVGLGRNAVAGTWTIDAGVTRWGESERKRRGWSNYDKGQFAGGMPAGCVGDVQKESTLLFFSPYPRLCVVELSARVFDERQPFNLSSKRPAGGWEGNGCKLRFFRQPWSISFSPFLFRVHRLAADSFFF